ncbi:conserved Plasmodium protein, unknown function [Plasmodium knowlesi strain H]|uniref:Programmed cell death protein 2 C-terminal domain-containing protein n=3 Tax=Plasmodium knowlesi TaxID=5850 RepID=A0A5K1VSJ9_PLAKH|nr:PDCD2 domain-containing protein, putative [Plasmodium knowlesi strain H]OTN67138.1 Uncharacterized protein PKNOH_S07461200 [Plasmodium knowlesi]CAA9988736.1 PDCD2 domain-containing protein, putative [Plasmodium knowlesi strain H]SBO21686.1 conserved Plasmodium protein, unknown function [Plasmodium knowlesi strain H]SBO22056.1 conserved Plasmodium protein, unknown function [Plasmodium knowlesi strain H]VVS78210.1 PDCD2 domain-containing protein, putative [Plasmodium knowlesi strain H]|eukprot:XP_002259712.1 hypothetical protein, conserved in Plasmodium species [Plasmodium knowlesi strain H]
MYIGVLSKKIDSKFDLKNDSKFGGAPVWLYGKEPTNFNLKCPTCKKDLTFLFQLSTSYNEYVRILYLFCCLNSGKCNVNRNSWICIKGKKKLFQNVGDDEVCPEVGVSSGCAKDEMCHNGRGNSNDPQKGVFSNYNRTNRREPIFDFSNENIKKEDSLTEGVSFMQEKLIDWKSLFSNKATEQKRNNSLFGNAISATFSGVNQKTRHNHSPDVGNNPQASEPTRGDELLGLSQRRQNEEKFIGEDTSYKLPTFYISLIEDDGDDCGQGDYLYEKAKKMHETYEQRNKENTEEDTDLAIGNGHDLDDIGEIELFENDFNGCVKFYSYLSKNYNQILRYSYNGKFLYMYKCTKKYIKERTMTCVHCGSKLLFEMQFFSTFVYQIEKKLEEEKDNLSGNLLNNFNVGNVIIFTCERDCVTVDDMYSYEHVELEVF